MANAFIWTMFRSSSLKRHTVSIVRAQKGFDGLSDGALSRALAPSVYCASCGHRLIRDYRRELIVCYLLSGRVYFAFHQKASEDDLFLARLSAGAMGQRPFGLVVGELGDKDAQRRDVRTFLGRPF
jgi:hypothetical protein